MRRAPRTLAAGALGLTFLGPSIGPALAQDFGTVDLYPDPALPGDVVAVKTAFCEGDLKAEGTAVAVGAGTFALGSASRPDVLTGQFRVPVHAAAGDYGIGVTCSDGALATGTLRVAAAPDTPATTAAPPTGAPAPASAHPAPHADAAPGPAAEQEPDDPPATPSGSVRGGAEGAGDRETALLAGGSALLAAAAIGGVWVLRRRHAGERC
ncbi:hypothetical protein PJ985_03790 [Streptomyces sp. ACA25]|uniref:hypothetical protein n=1 Tax=Streptomyces sp. ACA25 TaxID=3022596 RepID=UPI0023083413|nr:hypothetical protein [Streptomyces sp. ACA25]MDB1086689.1 hypothetical protein [Streptomyces sp. ACA25]